MKERTTIRRFFWVWKFEKEEAWLNAMAQSGWALESIGFFTYRFVRCEPGEYSVRLEMHGPDDAYINFMAETGAEYLGRQMAWMFFRKKAEDGPFDLFSDIDSRIGHLDRIGKMLLAVGVINLAIGTVNLINTPGIGWINLLATSFLMYALGRIHGKKEALQKERLLHE